MHNKEARGGFSQKVSMPGRSAATKSKKEITMDDHTPLTPQEPAELAAKATPKKRKIKAKPLILSACALVLAAAITLGAVGIYEGWFLPDPVPTTYSYVFVHGLNGWGDDDDALLPVSYWGATSCNLMQELTALGYDCCAPSVGPASSAWDRACELYAQLTGTRVDYGEAHAKEFAHERYGETYESALIPHWGEMDENGNQIKINLVGHSFGGATVRLLAHFLAYGDETEKAAAPDSSPLFAGGKGDWVYSITALTAPHNGTTLLYAIGDGTALVSSLLSVAGLAVKELAKYGIHIDPSMASHDFEEIVRLSKTKDNAYYDLTLTGADALNATIKEYAGTYYFSFAVDGTQDGKVTGGRVGSSDMMLILRPIAAIIGNYKQNTQSEHVLDDSWLPNDGLVNTISEYAPNTAKSRNYDEENMETGIWQVMPTLRGDHGSIIGLFATKTDTLSFYKAQLERIDALSKAETGTREKDFAQNWKTMFS